MSNDLLELSVKVIPVLQDNYIFVLRAGDSLAVVDPARAAPVIDWAESLDLEISMIITTHHHSDHIGGCKEIKQRYDCPVIGPQEVANILPDVDRVVRADDCISWEGLKIKVLGLPGHTLGHISYWIESAQIIFSGDVLFSLGCGRVFEGTFEQMYDSLEKLSQLPTQTRVYCTHEYTLDNGKFAIKMEPSNVQLKELIAKGKLQRSLGQPTIPTTIGVQNQTNPFLRTHILEVQDQLQLLGQSNLKVFTTLRELKSSGQY